MISILIATYQWDTEALVERLVLEISSKKLVAEIICIDDASGFVQSERFHSFPYLQYSVLDTNIGRSAIRNRLAKQAKYPLLLFLDADSLPVGHDFLSDYLVAATSVDVVCGGTSYYNTPPSKRTELLRWTYGKEREERSASKRLIDPYVSFTSNNFLISKLVFDRFPFDEEIREYGHEDTLFGIGLKENKVSISHIDNPVYHLGLDDGAVFLSKTEQAVVNLSKLYNKGLIGKEVRLIAAFLKLRALGLTYIFRVYFRMIEKKLIKNLLGEHPSLRKMDLYKLGLFVQQMKQ